VELSSADFLAHYHELIPAFTYALDGDSATTAGIETTVTWVTADIPDQSSLSVRFAVTATHAITNIVNATYSMTAANYPITFGDPITTLVILPPPDEDLIIYLPFITRDGPTAQAGTHPCCQHTFARHRPTPHSNVKLGMATQ
jgi:hypothetical protein